jgi:hypothetical protein
MLTDAIGHDGKVIVHLGSDTDVEAYSNLATFVFTEDEATSLRDQLTLALQFNTHRESLTR